MTRTWLTIWLTVPRRGRVAAIALWIGFGAVSGCGEANTAPGGQGGSDTRDGATVAPVADAHSDTTPVDDAHSDTTPVDDAHSDTTPVADAHSDTTPVADAHSDGTAVRKDDATSDDVFDGATAATDTAALTVPPDGGADGTSAPDSGGQPDSTGEPDSPGETVSDVGVVLDIVSDASTPPTILTCSALSACLAKACASASKDCAASCVSAATAAVVKDAKPLLGCLESQCLQGQCKGDATQACAAKCMATACTQAQTTCLTGGKTGLLGCETAIGCHSACVNNGGAADACLSTCLAALKASAQLTYVALASCISGGAVPKGVDCQSTLKACVGPAGFATCKDTYECAAKCPVPTQDPSCLVACLSLSSGDAFDVFVTQAALCNVDAVDAPGGSTPTGGGNAITGPPNWPCFGAIVACAAPSGTGNCVAASDCFTKCDTKNNHTDPAACVFSCAPMASLSAFSEMLAFAKCADQCKQLCDGKSGSCEPACVASQCSAAMTACLPPP